MSRCVWCGTENPEGSRFCGGCGRPLVEAVAKAKRGSKRWFWRILIVVVVSALGYVGYARWFLPWQERGHNGLFGEIPPVEVVSKQFTKKTKSLDIDVKLPVIRGLKDKDLQKRINTRLQQSLSEWIGEIDEVVKSHREDSPESYERHLDFVVPYNRNGLLSIVINYFYFNPGAAHGATERKAFNVDLKTGNELLISDFYRGSEDWEEIVKRSIYDQMLANPRKYFGDVIETWPNRSLAPDQPFYIYDDNYIVVFFKVYELAPGAEGITEFKVPVSLEPSEVIGSGQSY